MALLTGQQARAMFYLPKHKLVLGHIALLVAAKLARTGIRLVDAGQAISNMIHRWHFPEAYR